MKRLFWILLIANAAVFVYFKHADSLSALSSLKPEIHPEQIKLLTAQSVAAYPKRNLVAAPVAPTEPTAASAPEETSPPVITPSLAKPAEVKTAERQVAEAKPLEHKNNEKAEPAKADANKPEPAKASEPHTNAQTACYEWSGFSMGRVTEAAALAQQLNIKTQTNMTSTGQENVRYWIYKPPLASAEAAQTKAEELRKLGVEDFFIVQDDPKWRHAISFGVFRDEKLADKLMNDLKNKGVKWLVKATRNGGQAMIKLQQVTPQQYSQLQKSRAQFPDTVLKEMPCQ